MPMLLEHPEVEPWRIELGAHDWGSTGEASVPEIAPAWAAARKVEFPAKACVESNRGCAELELAMRVIRDPDNGRVEYQATQYQLTLRIIVDPGREGRIDWSLEPGSGDAALRAPVLDFLIALSGQGVLTIEAPFEEGFLLRLYLEGSPIDESLTEERRFLTDVMVIEGWTGYRFYLPEEISESDGLAIAEFAIRAREKSVRVRFKGSISAVFPERIDGEFELRLPEDLRLEIFGLKVPLGALEMKVWVRAIEWEPAEDGVRGTLEPLGDEWVEAPIKPPRGRTSVRERNRIDGGGLPKRKGQRKRAAAQAEEPATREPEPVERSEEEDRLMDEVRRRWPT